MVGSDSSRRKRVVIFIWSRSGEGRVGEARKTVGWW